MCETTLGSFQRVTMATDQRTQAKRFVRYVSKKQVLCQSQSVLPIVIHQISFHIFVYTITQLKAAMEKARQSATTL